MRASVQARRPATRTVRLPPKVRRRASPASDDATARREHKPEPERPRPGAPASKEGAKRPWRTRILISLGVLAALGAGSYGVLYWLEARHFESTDDAFLDGHISQIAPQVPGRVARLAVADNQEVEAGQVLLEIDPRDYQVKLDQALAQRGQSAAQLDQAKAQLALQRASLDQAQAQVRAAQADLYQAQRDAKRDLAINRDYVTVQQIDHSSSAARSAQAKLDANVQAVEAQKAQVDAQSAQIAAAEAALRAADVSVDNARLQLSYATLTAPQAGRVTRRTVDVGNYVNVGQALLSIVPDETWVTANFKETQLAAMKVGDAADVRVDAVPGVTFHGKVDSFQAGSGSVFSAIPVENATGNYVKVVQRVPVKIVFEGASARDPRLAPGLSAVPSVKVR